MLQPGLNLCSVRSFSKPCLVSKYTIRQRQLACSYTYQANSWTFAPALASPKFGISDAVVAICDSADQKFHSRRQPTRVPHCDTSTNFPRNLKASQSGARKDRFYNQNLQSSAAVFYAKSAASSRSPHSDIRGCLHQRRVAAATVCSKAANDSE